MPKESARHNNLDIVQKAVDAYPEGINLSGIAKLLEPDIGKKAIQYRLRKLVSSGQIRMEGTKRGASYFPAKQAIAEVQLSRESESLLVQMNRPVGNRQPATFRRDLIESYRPNKTQWLSPDEKNKLLEIGSASSEEQAAGTYARRIMDRLLIDLSWNSSRLEGNTYSLLDTRRLIAFGEESENANATEAQMIRNHRDAIEFLVDEADEINFNRYTILNLHALLANNLLPDPMSAGRVRSIPVAIARSTYLPLDIPQQIETYFDLILKKATEIENPFEQALMVLAFLPYLQPFDDVNKRVSRLAANIPLIKNNLIPISFIDVPTDLYTKALLGFYESTDHALLKDLFIWAYDRASQHYAAVRQQLGAPDPFRMQYRNELRTVIQEIVKTPISRGDASQHIKMWAADNVSESDREQFRDVSEVEIISLHSGNFARYRIKPSEFDRWQDAWDIQKW